MSTSNSETTRARVLVVGLGGLGCPALLALARAGSCQLVLCDDDCVDESNLHRQLLYGPSDVGRDKLDAAHAALTALGVPGDRVELVRSRFLPDNARELARSVDLVLEGADNFATKFLAADACRLESRPVVHGAAIRWRATVFCVPPGGQPCYRCLFEDAPGAEAALNCAEAGVMGPVVGFAGALMAELALRVVTGEAPAFQQIFTFDGKTDTVRAVPVSPRSSCALCGPEQTIFDTRESRYTAANCAA